MGQEAAQSRGTGCFESSCHGLGKVSPPTPENSSRGRLIPKSRIIRDNISTALVLESDADWDLRIRDILANVARGVKKVADYPFTEHPRDFPTNKPYGDNWDLLWIGNCGSAYHGSGRFYAFNDSAVPPPDREFSVVEKPTSYQRLPGTRTVFEVSIASCTWGYAISNRGAVKLRKFLEEAERPIDCRLDRLCDDEPSLTCIGVYPQVISSAPSKSNIDHSLLGDSPPIEVDRTKEGHLPGPAVQYSARRNAHIIAQGLGRDSWISEF